MVIRKRRAEEVARVLVERDLDLSAAAARIVHVAQHAPRGKEVAFQRGAADFEQRDRPLREEALDSYPDARFEVASDDILFTQARRDRAMGENDLPARFI